MASAEFTSTGKPGFEPEIRQYGRLYQTYPKTIFDTYTIIQKYRYLKQRAEADYHRRIVFRCVCPNEIVTELLEENIPVEAIIPLNLINEESASILFIGENFHPSPLPTVNIEIPCQSSKKPIEKIETILQKGFKLSNKVDEDDCKNLYDLWKKFGWSEEGIIDFINRIKNEDASLYFSGVRDDDNQLISACQAEVIEFAGLTYIETTEYSTLDGYNGNGLCTVSVQGLIAQLLWQNYYLSNRNYPPIITAELNTDSTSPLVGISSGFIFPQFNEKIPQILSYNVAVLDGSPPNNLNLDQWNNQNDVSVDYNYLRNFLVAFLPLYQIELLYPPQEVETIISFYNH
jgi:hypothetical protein